MPSLPPRYRAFTLIEMLVVISILSLLVAILLPSLTKARNQAKGVLCLTRLRELSHGWHMYADDHNDVSVPGRYANAGGGTSNPANWYEVGNGLKYRPRWTVTMGRYVGLFAYAKPSTMDDRQDYEHEVYHCPAVPEIVDERNAPFGYNHQFLGNSRKTDGEFHNFPVKRTRLRATASTVLGADCLGTAAGFPPSQRKSYQNNGTDYAAISNHAWTLDPPRLTEFSDIGSGDDDSPRTAADTRHGGNASTVFIDGHGQLMTPYELGYRTGQTGEVLEDHPMGEAAPRDQRPHNKMFSGTSHDNDPPALPGSMP